MSPIEIAQEEARKVGVELSEKDADYYIWEKTGFPCYWPDRSKTPEENFRMQLREYFEKNVRPTKAPEGE